MYDGDERTTAGTLHASDDPGARVGENATFTAPPGADLAAGLERAGPAELTRTYTAPRTPRAGTSCGLP